MAGGHHSRARTLTRCSFPFISGSGQDPIRFNKDCARSLIKESNFHMPSCLQPQCFREDEMKRLLWFDIYNLKSPNADPSYVPAGNICTAQGSCLLGKEIEGERCNLQRMVRRDRTITSKGCTHPIHLPGISEIHFLGRVNLVGRHIEFLSCVITIGRKTAAKPAPISWPA